MIYGASNELMEVDAAITIEVDLIEHVLPHIIFALSFETECLKLIAGVREFLFG